MLSFGNNGRGGMASFKPGRLSRFVRRLGPSMVLIVLACAFGCGGSKTETTSKGEKAAAAPKTASKSKPAIRNEDSDAGESKSAQNGVKKSSRGIPYDAFFNDPLGEVANTAAAPMAATVVKTDAASSETPTKPTTDTPKAAGGRLVWSDFISIDVVQDETKKLRNQITTDMQGPGSYNKKCKDISWDAAALAGLAGIGIEHSEAASWKTNAHFIRDFCSELSSASGQPGKAADDDLPGSADVPGELFGEQATVRGGIACADHADEVGVFQQMRVAAHGEDGRGIGSLQQQARVVRFAVQDEFGTIGFERVIFLLRIGFRRDADRFRAATFAAHNRSHFERFGDGAAEFHEAEEGHRPHLLAADEAERIDRIDAAQMGIGDEAMHNQSSFLPNFMRGSNPLRRRLMLSRCFQMAMAEAMARMKALTPSTRSQTTSGETSNAMMEASDT